MQQCDDRKSDDCSYGFYNANKLLPIQRGSVNAESAETHSFDKRHRLMRKRISGPGGMCFSTVVFNFVHNSTVEGARGAFSVYVY